LKAEYCKEPIPDVKPYKIKIFNYITLVSVLHHVFYAEPQSIEITVY